MNLSAHDPQSVRLFFKRRQFESGAILVGVFLLCAGVFSWVSYYFDFEPIAVPMLIGDIVAAAIAYYVYLYYSRQPMRVRCVECGGSVDCRTPWVCGQCGHQNWNVNKYPFIRHCEECLIEPKSYICHHFKKDNKNVRCEEHIFFSEDHDKSNPARRIVQEGLETKKRAEKQTDAEREVEQKKRDLRNEYDEKKQALDSAKVDLTTEQIKAQIEIAKKGASDVPVETALNIHFESLKEFMDASGALDEAVRLFKTHLAEQLKGNPTLLKKRYLEVDAWRAREFAKLTKNPTQK